MNKSIRIPSTLKNPIKEITARMKQIKLHTSRLMGRLAVPDLEEDGAVFFFAGALLVDARFFVGNANTILSGQIPIPPIYTASTVIIVTSPAAQQYQAKLPNLPLAVR